jgi:uncharacterized protein
MLPVDHLLAAALRHDASSVGRLLDENPSLVSARNMFGASVVHVARFGGDPALEELLERRGFAVDGFLAAELGREDLVERAIAEDPSFATRYTSTGSTALHGAAYWGQCAVVELLLAAGADPNAATRDTFLQIAPLGSAVATTPGVAQPSDDEDVVLELVRALLEHGADANARRQDGATALHAAAFRGLRQVVQELLDASADPTITADDGGHRGQTPADTALSQGHLVLAADLDVPGTVVANPYA